MSDHTPPRRRFLVRPIIFTLLGIAALVAAVTLSRVYQNAKRWAVYSCVVSVHSHLREVLPEVPLTVRTDDGGWRVLCGYNYRRVCRNLHATRKLDAGWGNSTDTIEDYWRRPLLIAVRRQGGKWETSVLSKGRDGRLGTEDDIMSPHRYEDGRFVPTLPVAEVWREAR